MHKPRPSLCKPTMLTTLTAVVAAIAAALLAATSAQAAELTSVTAATRAAGASTAFEGVVEAVRQTVVAAQVPGAVVQLSVKAGDRVTAGQLLVRLDARAAEQSAAASDAQVQAARAALEVATRDVERQRQLQQKGFISSSALDQAEAQYKATRAQLEAQMAQAGATRTQSGFYLVRAPFAGIVADVPVSLGDMAMPGRPLLTLYDPAALRVTAAVPQSVAATLGAGQGLRIELPALPADRATIPVSRVQVLPTADPGTHTVPVRADLPAGLSAVTPGMYARLWLPGAATPSATGAAGVSVPSTAIVRRAELTGVYVLDATGKPLLRQVRLGRGDGQRVEVLAGLAPGERIATDPQAASRASGATH